MYIIWSLLSPLISDRRMWTDLWSKNRNRFPEDTCSNESYMEVILKTTHIWHSIIKCIYTTSSISWTSFYGYPDVTARYVKWMEVVDSAFFQRRQVEFVVYSFINIPGIGRQRQTCGGWWEKCSAFEESKWKIFCNLSTTVFVPLRLSVCLTKSSIK